MKRLLALLAIATASIGAFASVGASPALANGVCPSATEDSYSLLSGVATSYSGYLRLRAPDATPGAEVMFAVGGSTYWIKVRAKAVFAQRWMQVYAESNVAGKAGNSYLEGPETDSGLIYFSMSKDPAPATTWSASIGGVSVNNVNIGTPTWAQARATQPADFPCQDITADVTLSGASFTGWTYDSNMGAYYSHSLLSSDTLFRTYWTG